ncbi:TPA: arginine--tRNA ligase [Candidatus Dependentiae bacterium]|nr:MAG: Arginine-tRNA ligase [candidate division TM6 bacterium GW2011_GWE2_31_21]KKP53744.1 MAG: Arginine-tRNA ligase [candidate division TM6 bacterium GW2011_GWF2_33_332]HBS48502.1 arginine--tRNA ligase [Candidatus Dependentiae bacterium]HBZ73117.1 arginine--tRNA ligase [Candidatus Dependentiae bacterium]
MNLISKIRLQIVDLVKNKFALSSSFLANLDKSLELGLNIDKDPSFGDLSCNIAMILANELKRSPREIALDIKEAILQDANLKKIVVLAEIAGPGFLNLTFDHSVWRGLSKNLLEFKEKCFKPQNLKKEKVLVEFVSANPTGPLHLGGGRGGIIGDVLGSVLKFLGDDVEKEYYINDAGNQVRKLGNCLKIRCEQELGMESMLPEDGYAGEYLIDLAKECIAENGKSILEKPPVFFENYAIHHLLKNIKKDLSDYGIIYDTWFSEKTLHEDGSVKSAMKLLFDKELAYESEGAIWFKSSQFGDDKDRVIQKHDDTPTYIAADIAYHKNKFDRGFTKLINVWGQDHHGYVKRLKATMEALGYPAESLDVILNQLVSIKKGGEALRMSKRSGVFTTLRDIIDLVGKDVARFFYLNRKADAHLEFDLEVALKKTDENPVYYIQYAYVRCGSVLEKAKELMPYAAFLDTLKNVDDIDEQIYDALGKEEIVILKKLIALESILSGIRRTYGTHMLAYYVFELSKLFHNYYANNRIIDSEKENLTKCRLMIIYLVRENLSFCLDLLGLSKPQKM